MYLFCQLNIMDNFRLPNNVIPIKYRITINPIAPEYEYFIGRCCIIYELQAPTNKIAPCNRPALGGQGDIILHMADLNINKIYLVDDTKSYDLTAKQYYTQHQLLKLSFELVPDTGMLVFEYTGKINNNSIGLCKARIDNSWILYTHFEPTDARRCFPCFDEPSFKSTFNIEILAPENRTVLSNMPIRTIKQFNNRKLHIFNETPIMSTYLVAFYIGNLPEHRITSNNIPISIYGNIDTHCQSFLLNILSKSITLMGEIFGEPYSLPKMDVVIVPTLEGAAMENWGLIIINNNNIPSSTTCENKIDTAYTICHEIAHQWFGNLVTHSWWSEIFVNETMAAWCGWLLLCKIMPESFRVQDEFYLEETLSAYSDDILVNSSPIYRNINTAAEINTIFDKISYSKGAAVINMIDKYIGHDIFVSSLRVYIQKYKYKTASVKDLLNIIQQTSHKPINQIVDTWINHNNFPIVYITQNGNNLEITQEIFTKSETNPIWHIPLTNTLLLDQKKLIVPIDSVSKINSDALGLYVTKYDDPLMTKLLTNLNQLSNLDIANIMTDLYLLLEFGKISFQHYLKYLNMIIQQLRHTQPSHLLLKIILKNYSHFNSIIENTTAIKKYQNIIKPYAETVLCDNPTLMNNQMLSLVVMQLLNALEIPSIKTYFMDTFEDFRKQYLNNTTDAHKILRQMNPAIVEMMFKTAVNNDDDIYKLFYDTFKNNKWGNIMLKILPATSNYDNFKQSLDLFLSNDLTVDNKITLLCAAASNKKFKNYVWTFIKEQWLLFQNIFNKNQLSGIHMIETLKSLVDIDGSLIPDINTFVSDKDIANVSFPLKKVVEHIYINTRFNKLVT